MRNRMLTMIGLLLVASLAGCVDGNEADDKDSDTNDGTEGTDGMDGGLMAAAMPVAEGLDTVEEALAAGYQPDRFCVPGMGVHWIKPSLLDTELDLETPEVVLFLPTNADVSDPNSQFLGIEYVVVTQDTEMNSTETLPDFYGATFAGPMPGHFPGMPWHAEVHVYMGEGHDHMVGAEHPDVVCPPGTSPPEVELYDAARQVFEGLDTVDEALAAGYTPTSVCEPHMGIHMVKMAAFDTELALETPEVVMAVPGEGGVHDTANYTITGIEYVVVTEGQPTNDTGVVFMGVPLDGPMPGHFPGMPYHAELHVYYTVPEGESPYHHENHAITCPEGTSAPPMSLFELNAVTPEGIGETRGDVVVTEGPFLGQVTIEVNVSGLSAGMHGVHIHQNGDCSPASLGSGPIAAGGAGGHFDPDGNDHGSHAGDLGNIEVAEDGTGTAVFQANLTLGPGTYGISGRSLIVHANEDDGTPSADPGARVLCGVVA